MKSLPMSDVGENGNLSVLTEYDYELKQILYMIVSNIIQ